jgi:5-methylcytosine-specific restriction endonuclease McrA
VRKEKRCIRCKEPKPLAEFSKYPYITNQGRESFRYESRCKACNRARRMERYKANQEAQRADHRAWAKENREHINSYRRGNPKILVSRLASEHKRRARGWRNDHGPGRAAVAEALALARIGSKYLDAYSGELIDRPTIDHVTPLSLGGSNAQDNLCVTSRWNNTSKHDDLLIVWLARRYRAHSRGIVQLLQTNHLEA